MYSFDCPVCIAYLEELDMCDCGCGKYVCDMCGAAFDIETTGIHQVLYRNGMYCDSVAITVDDGEPAVAFAFRDAETYRRYVKWNAVRMGAACDQLDALLADDE
jgi:hypothetical protein